MACGIGRWILRQPTTLTGGLLPSRLVATAVCAVRWRDLGERQSAKGHHQRHHQRRDQSQYALPHLLTPFPSRSPFTTTKPASKDQSDP
jgi:hypothetical protein